MTEVSTSAAPAPEEGSRTFFPVVGIGASAGAVGALTRLFQGLPEEPGMAFVVVVHLSPDYASVLPDIIAKTTPMSVERVDGSQTIRANCVYVISPSQQLRMEDGRLEVETLGQRTLAPVAIDVFFRTLGEAHRERAVGIVLSGMGSDGTLGLRRIKECGGVSFAQSPDDAEYDTMPSNAIASGAVDFVLPAAQMGSKLVELWANARRIELPAPADVSLAVERPPDAAPAAEATAALNEVMSVLRERTKHDFKHYKPATVLRRLERRMQVAGVPTLPDYSRYLKDHADETPALLKDLLISVTNFFRDPEAFDALEAALAATLFAPGAEPGKVRAWAAGCATGEEAYSVAILLSELAARLPAPPELNVFASDIDERAIAVARAGLYPETISADVSAARLRQFFQREHTQLRVRKDLRERVLFVNHNLLRDPPFSNLDLVCCRNLLIYVDRPVQTQVLQILHFALRPGGLLFLGSAESADLDDDMFTVVDKKHRIYRAEPATRSRRTIMQAPSGPRLEVSTPAPARAAPASAPATLHEQLRGRHLPASVLIDEAGNIVHSTSETAKFLRFAPGTPSQSLLEAVRPELAAELHSALFKARQEHKSVEARQIRARLQEREVWVTMTVRPIEHDGARHVLVTFDDVEMTLAPAPRGRGRGRAVDPALTLLEDELKQTREELRSSLSDSATTNEELRASNEELQSINEELRSTTEELETSKEELQSVNEELLTVNQALKAKVDEATLVNDDLTNLIGATDIATIFVDRTMRIKRFTPRASQLFNLIPSDVGRSLLHITHRLEYDQLEADAMEAFETLRVIEREVRGPGGSSYFARMLPYRTRQDVIDGAVLTFIDISATRRAEQRVAAGEANLRLLIESTKDFAIIALDAEGAVTNWNEGAQRMFGFAADEIVGRPIELLFTPKDREDGAPQREMRIARDEGRASDERWHQHKNGTAFFCSGIMTPMFEQGRLVGYAKIARDLTDSKRAEIQLAALLEKETEVRAELQRAISMKDEFLAVMSHELKHPLNLIHVNAELLSRMPEARSAPAVGKAADVIRRAVLSQAKITDDLLDLSRLRTGKLAITLAVVPWAAVLTRVVDAVADDARAKNLSVALDAGPPGLAVRADAVRVEQIVWNLMSNALKFTPPGGSIELRLSQEGAEARLDVTDDGHGIAPDFIGEVFEMFRQADRSATRTHGGMGIGLALVKHLAEEQGGHVAVASEGLGRGSRFSVWLPLADGTPRDGAPEEDLPMLHGLHLLVVDDAVDALESFSALLRIEGAEVTAVSSAQQALEALETIGPVDVILSDVAMPGMDGYELIRRVRANPRSARVPAIALTGFGRAEDAHRALTAGFDAHLAKPVQIEHLGDVLRRLPRQDGGGADLHGAT
jgi:two-component system, chemotaxis family, CheB/CheR fusion protein